uniref:Ornithodorin n=2 Tax=Ornithodoros moubata TaxID=6938 RepID=KUNI_ORNMO|nr:RecName: Full=Ornithodorin; AltName: Full=Thrombin inhibitor [Ornithodoros moubata]
LNVLCNNPHTADCNNDAQVDRYFREGTTCLMSPACTSEGYASQHECQQACFVGGEDHSSEMHSSCLGDPPTSCAEGTDITYYDSDSKTCKVLAASCPSGENTFESEVECQVACGAPIEG